MAAAKNDIVVEPGLPLYGARWLTNETFVSGGGGGLSKTGIPNALMVHRVAEGKAEEETRVLMENAVSGVAVSPSGKLVAVGVGERCHLVSASTLKSAAGAPAAGVVTDEHKEDAGQRLVRFGGRGTRLLTGGNDGVLRVWSVPAMERVAKLVGHEAGEAIIDADLNRDEELAVSVSWDAKLKVWDAATGDALLTIDAPVKGATWRGCAFSGHSSRVVYTIRCQAKRPTTATRWVLGGEKTALTATRFERDIYAKPLVTMTVSPDGTYLAAGTGDGFAVVVEATTLQPLRVFNPHGFFISAMSFSPDERRLLTASGDRTVRVVDTPEPQSAVGTLAFLAALLVALAAVFVALLEARSA